MKMTAPAPDATFSARYAGRTVLAVGAHPDDLELAVGGTLARLSEAHAHVVMAVMSIPGNHDTRLAEAKRAAEILGCELRVLIEPPRRIDDLRRHELVGLLDELVRELEPAAVLTHSAAEFHGDHVSVHHACVSTQRLRQFDFFAYSPTMCRPVPTPFHPRLYINVTGTIERKMRAINAHESQFSARGISTDFYRELTRMNGLMVGVDHAEGLDVGRMLLG